MALASQLKRFEPLPSHYDTTHPTYEPPSTEPPSLSCEEKWIMPNDSRLAAAVITHATFIPTTLYASAKVKLGHSE